MHAPFTVNAARTTEPPVIGATLMSSDQIRRDQRDSADPWRWRFLAGLGSSVCSGSAACLDRGL